MGNYEEVAHVETPFGVLLLIRRRVPGADDALAFEVKLGGALLMSSLVTDSERALSTLGIACLKGRPARVLVGGLGLGYTAVEALAQPGVESVEVVDLLPEVIRWHREGLVPMGPRLTADPRCRLTQGDVFRRLQAPVERPPNVDRPPDVWDAVLLDVDHTPDSLLRPEHGAFYAELGLRRAAKHVAPGGVLGVWSALAPEEVFRRRLENVFGRAEAHPIEFWNPNNDAKETNGVYLAHSAS